MIPLGARTPRRRHALTSWLSHGALVVAVGVLCALSLESTATAASASGPRNVGALPAKLKQFAHCPVDNPQVSLCLAASGTGTITINSTVLKENSPITLSLGLIENADGSYTAVLPDDGTPALKAPPVRVPGGLLNVPGKTRALIVTATPQLVGLPVFNVDNLLSQEGPAITLPTDVLLRNGLRSHILGSDCTAGSASDPVTLNLTDGTTSPPPPNTPITGSIGKLRVLFGGQAVEVHTTLVDNSFATPGVSDCGQSGSLDSILDTLRSLPSPAGMNSITLSGISGLAEASLISEYVS